MLKPLFLFPLLGVLRNGIVAKRISGRKNIDLGDNLMLKTENIGNNCIMERSHI